MLSEPLLRLGLELMPFLGFCGGNHNFKKPKRLFVKNSPQCPVTADIDQIRSTIANWFSRGSHSSFFLSLLQSIDATANTKWPVGYVLLVCSGRSSHVFYLGKPNHPKLLILIDYRQPRKPPAHTNWGQRPTSEALSIGCAHHNITNKQTP